MSYDGSRKWANIEHALSRDGYTREFGCMFGDTLPQDFRFTGRESGWELRRKIKAWCATHGLRDFVILRNTSYHRDLHGDRVYELWTRIHVSAAHPAKPQVPALHVLANKPCTYEGTKRI